MRISIVALISGALLLSGCALTEARDAAIADAKVKPLNMANSLRPGLVGLEEHPATGWQPGALAVGEAALAEVGLRDADLERGSRAEMLPDGTSLGIPTLDFCEARYPSESRRVKRAQIGGFDEDGKYAGISTEVVIYESAKAAREALAEVAAARRDCPVGREITTHDGHTLVFAFHSAPGPSKTPLVDADSRLVIHTTMKVDGTPQTAFLVYQIQGPALAALYVSDNSGKPLPQTTLDAMYGLAGAIAQRLQAFVQRMDVDPSPTELA